MGLQISALARAVFKKIEFPPPWSRLRGRGNSPSVRLTVLIPLVGYLIIFNSYVIQYIELAQEFGGAPRVDNPSVSTKLLSIYFGLCALALASVIYARYCPDEVKHYGTSAAYVGGDGPSIGEAALETIGVKLRSSDMAADYEKIAKRLQEDVKFNAQRVDKTYSIQDESRDKTIAKKEAANAMLHLYFQCLNCSLPKIRGACSILFSVGFVFVLIPSLIVFGRVVWLLIRSVAAAEVLRFLSFVPVNGR